MNIRTLLSRTLLALPVIALPLAFTGQVNAQAGGGGGAVPRPDPPNPGAFPADSPGNSNVVGTDGADFFTDHHGNDTDSQHDSPGNPGDGEVDLFSTQDGDNNDSMWGGPEDQYFGDPGDLIYMFDPDTHTLMWHGTFEEYWRIRSIIWWIQDMLKLIRDAFPGVADAQFWRDALELVSNKIDQVPWPFEADGSGTILFADLFQIGPYEFGEVPASPLGCLTWMPFPKHQDPVEETADLKFNSEQFNKALFTAKALVHHVIDRLEEE